MNGQIGRGKERVWLEWVASLGVQQERLVPVEKRGEGLTERRGSTPCPVEAEALGGRRVVKTEEEDLLGRD